VYLKIDSTVDRSFAYDYHVFSQSTTVKQQRLYTCTILILKNILVVYFLLNTSEK